MITFPEEFRVEVSRQAGAEGLAWVDRLPALVDDICSRWGLAVDGEPMHGTLGIVVPVQRTVRDGANAEPAVLKISWADTTAAKDTLALRVWDGAGAVRLLDEESSPDQHVMLLERLDSSRTLASLPIDEAVQIAGGLLRRLAVPAPDGVPSLATVAASTVAYLHEHGRGFGISTRSIEAAVSLAAELGPTTQNLLVHDDLHYGNVLAGTREPWLATDPRAWAGDPEYGVGPLLWTRLDPTPGADPDDPRSYEGPVRQNVIPRRIDQLVEAAALDDELTRGWTVVRCVGTQAWGLGIGLTYDPARCTAIIEQLLGPKIL